MRITEKEFSGDIISQIPLLNRKSGNQGTKEKFFYKNVVCAFDIETTRYRLGTQYFNKTDFREIDVGIMYVWQFQIGKNLTIFGRTWEEFNDLIYKLETNLNDGERLLIFVHNLSYEWNWLHDEKILGERINDDSVFLLDSRKVLRFRSNDDKLEFRCSYIHSNMSLDEFTEKMHVEHRKLSGIEFNYNKTRFPWTKLTEKELRYCENDVIGLVEAIYKELEVDNDTLYTIPLTSTGYVRREVKEAIKELPRGYYENMKVDYDTYQMLREAYRGGNCHASRWYANKHLPYTKEVKSANIGSADRSSSYPDVLLNCPFPVTRFFEPNKEQRRNTRHIFELIENGRAVIARVAFTKVKLHHNMWGCPYLSFDKCRNIKSGAEEQYKTVYDNGRIISCGYCETTVTDIDLKILLSSYGGEYDIERIDVIDYRFARYGQVSEPIKDVIRKYYRIKTELKGKDDEFSKIQYMKSKNKLNSIYGMFAQDPGKVCVVYNRNFIKEDRKKGLYREGYYNRKTKDYKYIESPERKETNEEREKEIARCKKINEEVRELCYETGDSTLPYQYGVWCTAWARYYLELAIRECGEYFIYADTDSVYYEMVDNKPDFTEYNKARIESSTKNNAYAVDAKGKTHYMGVMEIEHGDREDTIIRDFKTLGAKKYAWVDKAHGLNITISGVSKKLGKTEIMEFCREKSRLWNRPLHPLDVLGVNFVFNKAGGNEIKYIDESIGDLGVYDRDSGTWRELYIPSNAVISPSTYRVSLKGEYSDLLEDTQDFLYQAMQDGSIEFFSKILVDYPIDKIKKM